MRVKETYRWAARLGVMVRSAADFCGSRHEAHVLLNACRQLRYQLRDKEQEL